MANHNIFASFLEVWGQNNTCWRAGGAVSQLFNRLLFDQGQIGRLGDECGGAQVVCESSHMSHVPCARAASESSRRAAVDETRPLLPIGKQRGPLFHPIFFSTTRTRSQSVQVECGQPMDLLTHRLASGEAQQEDKRSGVAARPCYFIVIMKNYLYGCSWAYGHEKIAFPKFPESRTPIPNPEEKIRDFPNPVPTRKSLGNRALPVGHFSILILLILTWILVFGYQSTYYSYFRTR